MNPIHSNLSQSINIRPTTREDYGAYVDVCQRAAQSAYTNAYLGINSELFSHDNFFQDEMYQYWQLCFEQTPQNKSFVATLDGHVVGGISIHKYRSFVDVNAYYVLPELQNKGIGRSLWDEIYPWIRKTPIELEVFSHASKAIAMYGRRDFTYMGPRYDRLIHWPLWPAGQTLIAKRYRKNV